MVSTFISILVIRELKQDKVTSPCLNSISGFIFLKKIFILESGVHEWEEGQREGEGEVENLKQTPC